MNSPLHPPTSPKVRRRSRNCIEPLEARALFSAAASPVTTETLLGAQVAGPHGGIQILASETAIDAQVSVENENGETVLMVGGIAAPTVFDVATNHKSAHLEASLVVQEYDYGTGAYGDGMYCLEINVDFTAFEEADLYPGLIEGGRSLYFSQGSELSGSIVIESLLGETPLPPGAPNVLLSPDDGKLGANSVVIMHTRYIQPPHWPVSLLGGTSAKVARELFSQTPVLN